MIRLFRLVLTADLPAPQDPQERVRLATCAILLTVAQVDHEFTQEEADHLLATIRDRFKLDDTDARDLVSAAEAARRESNDLWQFTHSLNTHCTIAEKGQIMEEVWRMICADGMLDAHEEHLVRSLGKLLNLTHDEVIAAKLKAFDEYRNS